jgi:hypothetical protein
MKNNARRKHIGYKYDRAGRIIDGLIDNGRLILMISLCLSVSYMVSELSNLTPPGTDPIPLATESGDGENLTQPDAVVTDSSRRIQERSDYRVELYTKCADRSYEEQHKAKCEGLHAQTDETIENDTKNKIKNKTWSPDEGANYESDSQPSAVAIRTT